MNKPKRKVIAIASLALMLSAPVYGSSNDALLNLLVKKGIISQQEADSVRAEIAHEEQAQQTQIVQEVKKATAAAVPSKVEVAKTVEKLDLYGDLRLRYQYENARKQNDENNNDRSRWRYRLRLGSDYHFTDAWQAGVRLETANANDSTNANWGGFFDKNGDGLSVGLVYLQYTGDWLEARMGKHKHPFHISKAFWDGDINPEGLSEQIKLGEHWTLRAGQYIIDEENESKSWDDHDEFLLAGQVEFRWNDLRIAPMIMATTGGQAVNNPENGAGPMGENAQTWFHDFLVVQVPAEWKFKLFGQKQKLFGTCGWNIEGDELAQAPGFSSGADQGSHDQFFNLGWQIGSAKKAGEWEAGIEYRLLEAASYSPNLSDSDFGKNELNQKGVVMKAKYVFTDFLTGGLTGMVSENIDNDFQSSAAGNDRVDLIQVDLSAKF